MSDGYTGEIRIFAGNFAPRGWALCDGQLLAISANQALFSLLGTTYGGDGRSTFGLPDLRGRSAVHPGDLNEVSDEKTASKVPDSKSDDRTNNPTNTIPISATDLDEDGEITISEFFKAFEQLDRNKDGRISDQDFSSKETIKDSNDNSNAPDKPGIEQGEKGPVLATDKESNGPGTLAMNFIICLTGTFPSRN